MRRTRKAPVQGRSGTIDAPLWAVVIAFAGAVSALAGGYWDDAWHTERGRDEFLIPPHIAIYAGIAVAGGALTLWAARAVRAGGMRAVAQHRPLGLALLSVAVTLAAGPIDNAWHEAFGRDAVFWSPPHMLGIAGTLALGAAILAELGRRGARSNGALTAIAGALVLASGVFPVLEYDTDVPQFAVLWYLPALALGSTIALAIVRLASSRPYAATEAAGVHLGFALLVLLFLLAVGFPAPGLPLLIPAALALDLSARRAWSLLAQASVFGAALYTAYVPVRNWLGEGVRFGVDVLIGLPLSIVLSWAVLAAASDRPRVRFPGRHATTTLVLGFVLAIVVAPAALGHDPGQGRDAGVLDLTVTADGPIITVEGTAPERECRGLRPRSLAVRRGGWTLRAPLDLASCRLRGRIEVPERGRWFVYAELRRNGHPVESWLPVEVGDGMRRASERERYAYVPEDSATTTVQVVASAGLYAGMLALVVGTFALVRPTRQPK